MNGCNGLLYRKLVPKSSMKLTLFHPLDFFKLFIRVSGSFKLSGLLVKRKGSVSKFSIDLISFKVACCELSSSMKTK